MDTKAAILDAAEALFANDGFAGTSLRSVVAMAQVNLAAVNYHFGSKDGLLQAVLERRILPLNRERLRLLDACERRALPDPAPITDILEALVAPPLRMSRDPEQGGETFMRLLGRAYGEPDEGWQRQLNQMFGETAARFTAALRRTLPDLPDVDFFWRLHFVIGAMAHTMCDKERVRMISKGVCNPNDVDTILRQILCFLTAGITAPATPLQRMATPGRRPKSKSKSKSRSSSKARQTKATP